MWKATEMDRQMKEQTLESTNTTEFCFERFRLNLGENKKGK